MLDLPPKVGGPEVSVETVTDTPAEDSPVTTLVGEIVVGRSGIGTGIKLDGLGVGPVGVVGEGGLVGEGGVGVVGGGVGLGELVVIGGLTFPPLGAGVRIGVGIGGKDSMAGVGEIGTRGIVGVLVDFVEGVLVDFVEGDLVDFVEGDLVVFDLPVPHVCGALVLFTEILVILVALGDLDVDFLVAVGDLDVDFLVDLGVDFLIPLVPVTFVSSSNRSAGSHLQLFFVFLVGDLVNFEVGALDDFEVGALGDFEVGGLV